MRENESWGMNMNYLCGLKRRFCVSAPKRAPAIAIASMKAALNERVSINQK